MRAPEFWHRRDASARLISALLSPLGALYGASVAWKRDGARPFRARAKVLCVGNLTAGGTGKTPVAIALAKALTARGLNVVFLSRGYGGSERGPVLVDAARMTAQAIGDEPLLLAAVAPTIVARDRAPGARLADARNADVIVMDDGHQNFALAKDLSLVVVDSEEGFGNGRVIPAGPLREPVSQGLDRADAVIVLGGGASPLSDFHKPVLRAALQPASDALRAKRLVAFAGIGRPEKFFATLRSLGGELASAMPFPDHHPFTAAELARLRALAADNNATLVTTEKDLARIAPADRTGITALPVGAVFEDQVALARLLDRIAPPAIAASSHG